MNLKIDLSRKGLDMFFKDWQLQSLRVLWRSCEGLFSKDVWEQVSELPNYSISRSSIIQFLNNMVECDILSGTEYTGKGGRKLRYQAKMSEQELKHHLAELVQAKLNEMIKTKA